MRSAALLLLASGLCANAQDPAELFSKAPPDVDAALRKRVSQFYQAHVDRKLRDAEAVVAEDSKDYFFEIEKPIYFGFDIVTINYSEEFSKATTVVAVDAEWRHPRIGKMRVKQPVTATWKLDKGEWVWFAALQNESKTSFGTMKAGPDQQGGAAAQLRPVSLADVLSKVTVSAQQMQLSSFEASGGEVTVTNKLPGPASLKLEHPPLKGLEAKLEKSELAAGEETRVVIKYVPPDRSAKPTTVVNVKVEQTSQAIPITLTFSVPPELEKHLPKNAR